MLRLICYGVKMMSEEIIEFSVRLKPNRKLNNYCMNLRSNFVYNKCNFLLPCLLRACWKAVFIYEHIKLEQRWIFML